MPGSFAVARLRVFCVAFLTLLVTGGAAASALAASGLKVVRYRGYEVKIPRSWPVFDLAKDPSVCVRFDRHALYLGSPGAQQHCPAHAAGRTEAILLEPAVTGARAASAAGTTEAPLTSAPGTGTGSVLNQAHGIRITATWRSGSGLIRRALGLGSLGSLRPTPAGPRHGGTRFGARIASATPASPGGVYTGQGFDACSTPSASHMSAWGASAYRAIGVYIGGANMACAQPNLTASWVSQESFAGWHLIPIYVGLQAPSNSCGCAAISASNASTQAAAAAADAVAKAQALGLGVGNPIYFDMEGYSRSSSNSSAVLSFLDTWTLQLHARGYKSGVYSSDNSGITDLVAQYGSGYDEPDDIWIANWNGVKTTSDGNVPSPDWPAHQRVRQYVGGHNETHGGVTINIDGDYLDAATAAAGSATGTASEWLANAAPGISGPAVEGQTLTEVPASWPGSPTAFSYQWEDCNSSGRACGAIPGATGQTYTLGAADVGHRIRVQEVASSSAGTSVPSTSAPTSIALGTTPLYWLYTAYGDVSQSLGTAWYGSPIASHYRGASFVGMAATPDGKGYWLATSGGRVYSYGDAPRLRAPRAVNVKGIVAAPGGGYWLYSTTGSVYRSGGAGWYGSPAQRRYRGSTIVGMAATADGRGYWLTTSTGNVYAFGDAAHVRSVRHRPVRGIVAAPGGGFWLYTAYGNVYAGAGAAWYGSPLGNHYHGAFVTGMAATADGQGYWLVTRGGGVFAYGDANRLPAPSHSHPIIGMAG